tara:strand:- start:8634 stop:9227 length:594 start_codon:yes stop_codon:yes gene_type:complete
MALTATTKLEAVNLMLSTIGEAPVNSLTSGLVDAELAETILASVSKAVQSEGWNFNTEKVFPFQPDASGHIILPANILRADATAEADALDLVQRGLKMYDKKNHTYVISATVNLDIIIELEFEELPEVARRYIALRSARVFQEQVVGSDTLNQFNRAEEFSAYSQLKDFEAESEDNSIYDNYSVYQVLDRTGSQRIT